MGGKILRPEKAFKIPLFSLFAADTVALSPCCSVRVGFAPVNLVTPIEAARAPLCVHRHLSPNICSSYAQHDGKNHRICSSANVPFGGDLHSTGGR